MPHHFGHGGNVFQVARSLGVAPEEIVDFSASINPLGPAPGVAEAFRASFERIGHYPDSEAAELREALARHHGVAAGEVIAANGSTELIRLAPRLVNGRRGLIVAPAFSEYANALTNAGMESHYFTLDPGERFALSVDLLERRLAEGYAILFLCNPGNPSGALVPLPVMERVVGLCRSNGTFLVVDEAFIDFCEEGSAKRLLLAGGDGVVLRSMTKFFAIPGLRLGYAIAPAGVIGRMAELRGPWSVNLPAQAAGVASLAAPDYILRTREFTAIHRAALAAGLEGIDGLTPYPSAANYLLVEIGRRPMAGELRERLLRLRIMIRGCADFHGLDDRFIRVAVKSGDENGRLLAALREVYRERQAEG